MAMVQMMWTRDGLYIEYNIIQVVISLNMALSMTFKNPCVYTEEEAEKFLEAHGWKNPRGQRSSGSSGRPYRNPNSKFFHLYGDFSKSADPHTCYINKILDIEIKKRCFRKYTTKYDLRNLNGHHCVNDEPHYCRWEKDFIRTYVIEHPKEPVIDILMIIPTESDMVDYINNEMFRKRTIRPISNSEKVYDMARTFIMYISRGLGSVLGGVSYKDVEGEIHSCISITEYQQSSDQFKQKIRDQINII